MSKSRRLVIRADATPAIGAGHLMRCAAVAEAWRAQAQGDVYVWGRVEINFAAQRLKLLNVPVGGNPPAWGHRSVLLVDTYEEQERNRLATAAGPRARVLVDDIGGPVAPGYDAVWLPSAAGDASLYPGFRGAVFTGIESVALRGDLPTWTPGQTGRIGVLLGGGGVSGNVAMALDRLGEAMQVQEFVAAGADLPAQWTRLDAADPWKELATCARLVAGAGSIMWEAAAVGIPVVLLLTAENQRRNFEWGQSSGVPGVVAAGRPAGEISQALLESIPRAAPLPHIRNGARHLARELDNLVEGMPRGQS